MKKENVQFIFPEVVVGELSLSKQPKPQQTPDKDSRGKERGGFTVSLVTPTLRTAKAGYSEANRGFTLIELLVVVLIIGILAAVALPQYNKAVEKSRVAQAIVQVRALGEAEKRYYLENNKYTDNFEELDISFLGTLDSYKSLITQENWELVIDNTNALKYDEVYARRIGTGIEQAKGRWYIRYNLGESQLYCGADPTDQKSMEICKTLSKEGPKDHPAGLKLYPIQ